MGWQNLLKRHGLDITKADLAAELVRELTIDRGVPGFEDFTLAGKRGVERDSLLANVRLRLRGNLTEIDMFKELLDALDMAFAMGWEILWPLVLGFALSAVI